MADEVIRIKYVVDGKEIVGTIEDVEELKKQLGLTEKEAKKTEQSLKKAGGAKSAIGGLFNNLKQTAGILGLVNKDLAAFAGRMQGLESVFNVVIGNLKNVGFGLKNIGGGFKDVAFGADKAGGAMKLMAGSARLLGGAIGAGILAAGSGLIAYFTRSQEGADELRMGLERLRIGFGNVVDLFAAGGKVIWKNLSGDIFGAAQAYAEFQVLVKGFKDDLVSDDQKIQELTQRRIQLEEDEITLIKEGAELAAKSAQLREEAYSLDENETKKKVKLLQASLAILKELEDREVSLARRRAEIMKEDAELNNTMRVERKAIAEQEAKAAEVQRQYAMQRKEIGGKLLLEMKKLAQQETAMIAEEVRRRLLLETEPLWIPIKWRYDSPFDMLGPETKAFLANIDKEIAALLPKDMGMTLAEKISPWSIKDLKFLYNNYKETLGDQADEVLAELQKKQAERDEIIFASVDAAQRVSDSLFQITNDRISAEIAALEQKQLVEVGLAGDNQAAIQRINEQYDAKLRELRTKQVRNQKAQGLFDAIINTATAVTKALATGGPVLAAIVGAAGAAQVAAISAQPIPRFKKGTLRVGGTGNDDTVPALLTPGEAVIPVDRNRDYAPVMKAIYNREIPAAVLNAYVKGGARERVVREREVIRDRVNIQIDERGYTTHTIKQANKVTRQLKRMSLNG